MKSRVLPLASVIGLLGAVPLLAQESEAGDSMLEISLTAQSGEMVVAGQPASLTIEARDPGTGHPLTGLAPAVWLVPSDQAEGECEGWVNRLAGSPVAPPGVLDLNGYDIVQLARDGTMALVDPQLNLATANIKSVHRLEAPLTIWATDPAGAVLAVVDEQAPDRVRLFDYGPLAERTALSAGSPITSLSVGDDDLLVGTEGGELLRYSQAGELLEKVEVGLGRVSLFRTDEGDFTAIAADGSGLVEGSEGYRIAFKGGPEDARDISYSILADAAIFLTGDGRSISTIYRDDPGRLLTQPLEAAAARLVPDLTGRWIALPAADDLSVAIFDTRIGKVRWTIATEDPLRDVIFSDSFLYLTHAKAGGVTRVVFDPDGNQPGIAMIAAGEAAQEPREHSRFPLIVRIPGNGIIAASMERRIGYMVSEDGAQAAMSSIPLRAGDSDGILLRYRGTREAKGAGHYRVQFLPQYGGDYLAVVRLDQPAIAHCSMVHIAGPEDPVRLKTAGIDRMATRPRIDIIDEPASGASHIEFQIARTDGSARLREAVLVSEDGSWRAFLKPKPLGGNRFSAEPVDTPAGRYRLFVELAIDDGPVFTLGTAVKMQ